MFGTLGAGDAELCKGMRACWLEYDGRTGGSETKLHQQIQVRSSTVALKLWSPGRQLSRGCAAMKDRRRILAGPGSLPHALGLPTLRPPQLYSLGEKVGNGSFGGILASGLDLNSVCAPHHTSGRLV